MLRRRNPQHNPGVIGLGGCGTAAATRDVEELPTCKRKGIFPDPRQHYGDVRAGRESHEGWHSDDVGDKVSRRRVRDVLPEPRCVSAGLVQI